MATVADAGETKVFVRRDKLEVKIEVNFVMRGTVHPVRPASLSAKAKEVLQADLELPLVSLEDFSGGKLVAAMDRQHPRDLFDVMELSHHEEITRQIRRAFVVYLASHNRPIHEVLFPNPRFFTVRRDNAGHVAADFLGPCSLGTESERPALATGIGFADIREGRDLVSDRK